MTRVLAVLQARTSSTRLPGKVLAPVLGRPMLERQLERVGRCATLDRVVVATSGRQDDDALAALCAGLGVDVFRGSLDDVLDRFYGAAAAHAPEHVVRLTGDCPLADPQVIDALVRFHLDGGRDYSSNCLQPSFPDGLDAEAMTFAALERAWKEAVLRSEREHVTLYITAHPELFSLGNMACARDLSALRWTVDAPEDLEFVRGVYQDLYPTAPAFGMDAVLDLLERRPELARLNAHIGRNEGLAKSLREDGGAGDETL